MQGLRRANPAQRGGAFGNIAELRLGSEAHRDLHGRMKRLKRIRQGNKGKYMGKCRGLAFTAVLYVGS